jgi:hypothetical protein
LPRDQPLDHHPLITFGEGHHDLFITRLRQTVGMPFNGPSIIPKVLSGLEPFNHVRSKYKLTSHLEADGFLFGEVSKGRY